MLQAGGHAARGRLRPAREGESETVDAKSGWLLPHNRIGAKKRTVDISCDAILYY